MIAFFVVSVAFSGVQVMFIAVAGALGLVLSLSALPFSPVVGRAVGGAASLPLAPEVVALLSVLGLLALGNGLLNVSLAALVVPVVAILLGLVGRGGRGGTTG